MNTVSMNARIDVWSATECETYWRLENGEIATNGTRTPAELKPMHSAGNGPVGLAANAGHSWPASTTLVLGSPSTLKLHCEPPPGRRAAGAAARAAARREARGRVRQVGALTGRDRVGRRQVGGLDVVVRATVLVVRPRP